MDIYVGNLNYKATEDEIAALFSPYGEVTSVKIISDRETGRSRGFCFVSLADDEAAKKAIEELNGKEFLERSLVINEARKKD